MGKVKEIWEPVKGFPDYSVSNLGRVISRKGSKEKFIGGLRSNGYVGVSLWQGSRNRATEVHRLVAEMFIPNPKGLPQVNHIDEDKSNNQVSNLEWCSAAKNANHGTRNSRIRDSLSQGVEAFNSSGEVIHRFSSTQEAQRNGFHNSNISSCCRGERKTHKGLYWRYA